MKVSKFTGPNVNRTYVYGDSDDLIEVEGARDHEFYVYEDDEITIGEVSIDVTYDGEWSFSVRSCGYTSQAAVLPNEIVDSERFNDYTEVVVIDERYL